MVRPEGALDVRGARDLAALWRALPVAGLRYATLPPGTGRETTSVANLLRGWAWRDHCIAPTGTACADRRRSCALAQTGRCRADAVFPVSVGGGLPSWRMSSLVPKWLPASGELWLIGLGEAAGDLLGWAARRLGEGIGLDAPEPLPVSCFGDLELRGSLRWRLRILTPWIVDKQALGKMPAEGGVAPVEAVTHELRKALRVRGHKFTALCGGDEQSQRLGSHLAHHVADALLPVGVSVEDVRMRVASSGLRSRGNQSRFQALALSGEAVLSVAPPALPWLTLIALCGGGENADEGFGAVELTGLD